MRFLFELFATLAVALGLGLGSAWYMVEAPRIGIEVGRWRAAPPVTAESADPYTRARVARGGAIPMGSGEGLVFIAGRDESGAALSGTCIYRIVGETPTSRLWTLSVVDGTGALPATVTGRTHLTSREILRNVSGHFEITVSATARAGNWLPSPASGPESLILRLYDTPVALSPGSETGMPRIEREGCR